MAVFYDVALSSAQGYFAARVRELSAQFNLSFFLVESVWVEDFLRKLQEGVIQVRVLIDMAGDPYEPVDPYFRLAKEVKHSGGYVIDDPDLTAITAHKGLFHDMLIGSRIPVPETVVVTREQLANFEITDTMKAVIGVPFVVKPAWGSGGIGVSVNGRRKADLLRSAEKAPHSDSFLIQERVKPKSLEGHVGWFRVFHVMGEVIPCWWEPPANQYQLVTPLQRKVYKLGPLARIVREIARVSKMQLFTTEICLTEDDRFLAVDYLNNDPDMSPKSFFPTGVPDEVIRHIAWLLVFRAMSVAKRGHGYFDEELEEKDQDWADRRRRGLLVPGE
jgi:hypothetical protein